MDIAEWRQFIQAGSPARLFILNGRKHVVPLPSTGLVQTGRPCSLLEQSAKKAFEGILKPGLLKLDREEVMAVTTETTVAAIRHVMIKKGFGG